VILLLLSLLLREIRTIPSPCSFVPVNVGWQQVKALRSEKYGVRRIRLLAVEKVEERCKY
jgi:hypothetical protein